jgi:flagellar export protein FliJ
MAIFALQPALDLAERRTEAKSRAVKVTYVAWLNARTRQVRLEQRRHLYGGELNARMRQGCSAATVRAAGGALHQWRADMLAAARELEQTRCEWQLALDAWQVEKKRLEALQLLARRHALDERRQEERRERRLHDEISSRSAHVRRLAEGEAPMPHLLRARTA